MKSFLLTILLCAAAIGGAQEGMMSPVPKETEQAKFFLGKWSCDMTLFFMGQESKSKGSMTNKMSIGNRWIESDQELTDAKMFGKFMVCYDDTKKKWVGYWFDSAGPGSLEMIGTLENGTLRMESGNFEMPGVPGKMVMRSTYKLVNDKTIDFLLEMQSDGKWSNLMKGRFTKSS